MITELYDDGFEDGIKQGKKEVIEEVKTSLKQANYEYDNEMSVDDNIGSAMLGEFAKGHSEGYASKCAKVRAEAIEEIKSKAHCDDVECWDCAFGDAEVGCLLKETE